MYFLCEQQTNRFIFECALVIEAVFENKLNQALLWAVSHQLACMNPSVYTQSFLNQRIDVSLIAQKLRYFPKRAYVS